MISGRYLNSKYIKGHCPDCDKRVELYRNEFEYAIFYVCQVCGNATVARKENKNQIEFPKTWDK